MGLTFFLQGGKGFLISNELDGCCNGTPVTYDVYDTKGNLITHDFITNPLASTGIAWDRTNFWTSNIDDGSVSEWSMTGAFIQTLPVTGGSPGPLIEEMSFNFAQTVGKAPDPGPIAMLGSGVVALLLGCKFRA